MSKKLLFAIIDLLPQESALKLKKRLVAIRNSNGSLSEKIRNSKDAFSPQYDPKFAWVENLCRKETIPLFSHTGSLGDILFSLYFCKELTEHLGIKQFDLHIRTGVPDEGMRGLTHPYGNVRISRNAAQFMTTLLEAQQYIRKVTCSDDLPENAIELDRFRDLKLNLSSGSIQNWYYQLTALHLPREFWKPVLSVEPDFKYQDKIFFSSTERYQNVYIDYSALEKYKDSLVFAGTPDEYKLFTSKYFEMEYVRRDTLLELARLFAGAKGFIGNQGGLFSVAECLKIPRILISPEDTVFKGIPGPGPHVNHPQGSWNEDAATTEKMEAALEELLKL